MNVSRRLKLAAAQEISSRVARLGKDSEPAWTVHAHTILEWLELDVPPDEISSRIATLGERQGGKAWDISEQTIAAVLSRHYHKTEPQTPKRAAKKTATKKTAKAAAKEG